MELKSHTTPSNLMSHQPSSHALQARHTHQPSSLTTLSSNQGGFGALSGNLVGIATCSPANQQSEIIKELMKKQIHHKHKRSELPASLPQFKFEKHIKLPVGGYTQSGVYQQSLNPQMSSTSLGKDQNNIIQATPNSQSTHPLESPQQLQSLGSSAKLTKGGGGNSGNAKRVTFEPQLEEPSDSSNQQDEQSQSEIRKHSSDEQMISYVRDEFSAGERAEAEGIVESLNHNQRGDQTSSSQPRSGSHHRRQRVYINGSMIPQNYDLNPGSFYHQSSQPVCQNQEISDRESRGNEEEDTLNGENAPTVVIDDSADSEAATLEDRFRKLDDLPIYPNEYGVLPCPQSSSGGIRESKQSVQPHAHDNIQAALLSIRKQEQEERVGNRETDHEDHGDNLKLKKPVAVMSAEEEETLIYHINEIRDRIRRGESAAQQQQRLKEFSGDRSRHQRMQSHQLQMIPDEDEDSNYQQEIFNEYGGGAKTNINRDSSSQAPIKPPLYSSGNDNKGYDQGSDSNTYDTKNTQGRLEEIRIVANTGLSNIKQRSFHSIDTSNIPGAQLKCLIMTDEPNIYEKKRQRFERIQRMRNGTDSSSREPPSHEYGASLQIGSDQAPYQYENSSLKVITNSNLMKKTPVQQQAMLSSLDSVRTRQQQDQSITKAKKSGGKTKSISQKIIQKTAGVQKAAQPQPNQGKRVGTGKSRQLSTADQLNLILTSQTQQYQHNHPSQIAIYHNSAKSAQQVNPQKKENARSKSTSRSGSKDKPRGNGVGAAYSHKTLDQDKNNNVLQDTLAHQIISNTYRPPPNRQSGIGLSSGGYDDDEELQIQLFSLKKVVSNGPQGPLIVQSTGEKQRPSARPQTTSSIVKKKNLSKSRKGTQSIYVPPHQNTNQGSIVVPSIQYPGTVIHHKQQKSMSNHVKNNKSNLMINLEGSQQPHVSQTGIQMMNPGLAHSLSLKRLKTPKMKQKEIGNTPPLEKNLQNFLQQQAQFSSISHVIPQKLQPASSGTKHHNPALNYQTTATNTQQHQKSPFAYPHTSKASQLVNMVNAALSGNNMLGNTSSRPQIIDQQRKRNNSGGGGGHHAKQKSMQINSVSQLGIGANIKQVRDTSNNRSGSVGHKGAGINIEPGIAQKVLSTKQQVDLAFEVMKKKIGEVKMMPPLPRGDPINIQPIKTISSVSTLTSQSNKVLYAGSMNLGGHHRENSMTISNPKQPLHGHSGPLIHHKPTQSSIPTKNTPFFGGHQSTPSGSSLATLHAPSNLSQATDTFRSNPHIGATTYQQPQQSDSQSRSSGERVMQLHQVNIQAVQDFERNYRKLSQMLDKIFQHAPE